MSSETTDTPELITCPDCGRVWDGFAQCFPCEPLTPETSVEVSEVTEVSTATPTPTGEEEVVEVLSPPTDRPPVSPLRALEELPGFKDPQDFFAAIGRAEDDDTAWQRVRAALGR